MEHGREARTLPARERVFTLAAGLEVQAGPIVLKVETHGGRLRLRLVYPEGCDVRRRGDAGGLPE